jgi:hypothetical protein
MIRKAARLPRVAVIGKPGLTILMKMVRPAQERNDLDTLGYIEKLLTTKPPFQSQSRRPSS